MDQVHDPTLLRLDGTAVKDLPDSIGLLSGLQILCARNCKHLTRISISDDGLKALRILDVSGCSSLKDLTGNLGQSEDLEELRLDETVVTKVPTSLGLLKKLRVLSFRGCPFHESSSPEEFQPESPLRTPLCLENWIFPNLSSVTDLDLSYCNLQSSSIPSTFSYLSSLRRLNISGNPFEYLPDGIYRLPNLQILYMAHCRFLNSMSHLPPSIYGIDASNCSSLLMAEYPGIYYSMRMRSYNFMNCQYLFRNVEFVARDITRTSMSFLNEFSVILPGSGIRMWSQPEKRGYSAKMNLPNNWYDANFRDLALWVVFSILLPLPTNMDQSKKQTRKLDFRLTSNKQNLIAENGFTMSGHTERDHVWLRYFSSSNFRMRMLNKRSSDIEVSVMAPGMFVTKCGLYPLCLDNRNQPILF